WWPVISPRCAAILGARSMLRERAVVLGLALEGRRMRVARAVALVWLVVGCTSNDDVAFSTEEPDAGAGSGGITASGGSSAGGSTASGGSSAGGSTASGGVGASAGGGSGGSAASGGEGASGGSGATGGE